MENSLWLRHWLKWQNERIIYDLTFHTKMAWMDGWTRGYDKDGGVSMMINREIERKCDSEMNLKTQKGS